MLKLLTVALLVATASARCANQCAGHGQCGANDRCTCYAAWQGSDCSLRSCPHGNAWVDTASATDTAHNYAECSNRGTCDRKTGLCSCADGYTGMACARTTCPNDCNGHGTCETIAELAVDTSQTVGGKSHAAYTSWDAGKTRGCKCDPRYSGHDCSVRMCPRGDDPLTTEVDITQTQTTSLQVDEVQNVTVQSVNAPINGGEVTFTYTDLYNGVWTTRPVELPLVKTWSNKVSALKTSPFMWEDTSLTISAFGTDMQFDSVTSQYYVSHTLAAADNAAGAALYLRKGDWVAIAKDDASESCMCNIYEDVGTATALSCIVPVGQNGDIDDKKICKSTAGVNNKVRSAWSMVTSGATANMWDGSNAAKSAVSYVSATGLLTIGAGIISHATTPSLTSEFVPGQMIRIYDEAHGTGAGEFCDFRINGVSDATTVLKVQAASATSTKVDSSTGVGNSGGSIACNDFSGKTYAIAKILGYQSPILKAGTAGSIYPTNDGAADDILISVYNGVVTLTRTANGGTTAAPFLAKENAALSPGANIFLYNDASNDGTGVIQFKCACRITSYLADAVTNTLTCVDTGLIAGASLTQCSSLGNVAKLKYMMIAMSRNSVHFNIGTDDSATNPNYFTGLQSGDQVAIVNTHTLARDGAVTYEIDTVDDVNGRAIHFKTGSAPNGGGMYPIIPPVGSMTYASSTLAHAVTPFSPGAAVQAVHAANCAATWCATEAATSDSAKQVKRVLEELPNQVLADVAVSMTSNTLGLYAYSVTFAGVRNSGDQASLIMNGKGCSLDGCQPRYTGVRTQTSFLAGAGVVAAGSFTDASELFLTEEDMDATGGEELVLYQAGGNNGAKFKIQSTTDTVASFQYATGTVVGSSATGVLILRATGESGVASGGVAAGMTHRVPYFKSETYEITRGTKESTECSGRGNCDTETGLCECSEGYTGEACATQSVLV